MARKKKAVKNTQVVSNEIEPDIVLPTQLLSLGEWTEVMLQRVLTAKDNYCLVQAIVKVWDDLFPLIELEQLVNKRLPNYDETCNKIKGSSLPHRVSVAIGHHAGLACRFFNGDKSHFFKEVEEFYVNLFETNETENVRKAIQGENVLHLLVINEYWEKTTHIKKCFQIIGAASFLILEDFCKLYWSSKKWMHMVQRYPFFKWQKDSKEDNRKSFANKRNIAE